MNFRRKISEDISDLWTKILLALTQGARVKGDQQKIFQIVKVSSNSKLVLETIHIHLVWTLKGK